MGKEKREGLGLFIDLVEDMFRIDESKASAVGKAVDELAKQPYPDPTKWNESGRSGQEHTGLFVQRRIIPDGYTSKPGKDEELEKTKKFMLAELGMIIAHCTSDGRDYFVRSVFTHERPSVLTTDPGTRLSLVAYVLLLNVDDAEVGEAVFALPFNYATEQKRIVTDDNKVWQRSSSSRVGWERIA